MTLLLVSIGLMLVAGLAAFLARHRTSLAHALGAGGVVLGAVLGLVPAAQTLSGAAPRALALSWGGHGTLHLGLDPLSAFFLLPVLVLPAIAAVYATGSLAGGSRPAGTHWFFFDVLVASLVGVLASRDGLTFLVCWEVMALSSFFLVAWDHDRPGVRAASWVYLVATHLGTAFLFPFFLVLGAKSGAAGLPDFATLAAAGPALPAGLSTLLFAFAVVGFGTKAGFMPLHAWLPEAYPVAPCHVSAVLSGAVAKVGLYGLFRALTFLGVPQQGWGFALVALGAAGAVLGILFALAQHDLKRLLAYSSVENVGLITLSLGLGLVGFTSGQPALAALGLTGALLHVLNHSLFKGLLFLGAGAVVRTTGTRELDQLGGLSRYMPWTAASFLLGAVAICGLPPLNGFVSELLIYAAGFSASGSAPFGPALAGLVAVGSLALVGGLAAATLTKAFGVSFLGEPRSERPLAARDPGRRMRGAMAVLAAGCVVLGLSGAFPISLVSPVLPAWSGRPAAALGWGAAAGEASLAAHLEGPQEWLGWTAAGGGVLLLLVALLLLLRRRLLSGREVGTTGTWDCGYAQPTARMQYTGSSFADPIVRVFWPFLRTRHSTRAPTGFFPTRASLSTVTPDLGSERVFGPVFAYARAQLERIRVLQQGAMYRYVLYIAVALLVLLVWKL